MSNTDQSTATPIEGTLGELPLQFGTSVNIPDAFIEAMQKGQEITAAEGSLAMALAAHNGVLSLPEHFKNHDLEQYLPTRRRARGTMNTPFIKPFADYARCYASHGACTFVDANKMQATAVLDLGTKESPGHADNKATLTPNRTAAYQALQHICNHDARSQQEVAEFFEDWAQELAFFSNEEPINHKQAVAAVRRLTIESMSKLDSEEQSLSTVRSAFESVTASSKEPIPSIVYFHCQPYADLQARTFVLRLAILTGEKLPRITLRIQKADEHTEAMAAELGELVHTAMAGAMPVLIGAYSKAN